ncbi:MAG: 1-acyl-sn-glycerol-3-phosphate acyltransferase [Odoribacteraceae bacterium]|jgi:1-acyl-sn-glycerol-3-phosphate acyltransferase|nr:1-acyl-sn-glycerol-3-phosphate acyltransferase [Odoribacteraceae bacterium]
MTRLFLFLYTYLQPRRKLLFFLLLVIAAGAFLSLSHLEYREDIADFLPGNKANERVNAVYRHAGNANKIILFFSTIDSTGERDQRVIEAIDRFALLLEERDTARAIPRVISRVDEESALEVINFIRENPPYFLEEEDYARVDSLLRDDSLAMNRTRENKRLLMLPAGSIMRQEIQADPLHLFSPLLLKLKTLRAGEEENTRDGYLFTGNGKKGMIILESPHGVSETARNATLVNMLEEIAGQVTRELPDTRASLLGAPVIAVTNAGQIKKDSMLALSLSALLVLPLLFYFFRSSRDILLVFLSVLFGWIIALALLSLFKGSVSIIAIGVGSIFVGIAINYPLHLVSHARRRTDGRLALKEIATPLLVGNVTTVSAFLSLLFISSSAMRDLGLFGSLLLVGTILFVLLFLPHFVKTSGATGVPPLPFGRLAAFAPEKKRWIAWTVALLTILFLYASRFTAFEPDMNKINYMTGQQREEMNELLLSIERRDRDVVYLVSAGNGLDSALSAHERNRKIVDSLQREGLIESAAGVGCFLPSRAEQQRRIERWNNFWASHRDKIERQVEEAARAEGFKPGTFDPFLRLLRADFMPRDEAFFSPVSSLLADSYLARDGEREMVIALLYCEREKTAALSRALQTTVTGESFFFDSRDLGRRVVDALSGDFNRVLYICGAVVFLFLALSFGRLELSVIAFLPLAVGWVWILGIMQLADVRFNIVNVILATFIFGQGDDYTIFITEGLIREHAYRREMLASYKNSIILSALVMFAGIGTLVFAHHPALRSLAEVTIIGMFTVVMMAYLVPPLLFRWLTRKGGRPRTVPVTARRLLYSCHAFAAFLLGCLAITAHGFFLFTVGKKTERKRAQYHAFLQRVARFVIQHVPGTHFRLENLAGETFERPAVIISNHQSHLDLMCLIMLTPRLVILTNDWVWRNPFYGRLVKYADFYPVSGGIEANLGVLAERFQAGYSIAIFPEGTRSADCSIRRFHRGAFYLAERLNADIIPILLHGPGHVLPKEDFMLRRGTISVQIHPRIPAGGETGFAAKTRKTRQFYLRAYTAIEKERENADYFSNFVLHNYFYKGAAVEREARRMLDPSSGIARAINAHRGEGNVLVENNGNGLFSFLLALANRHARVFAIDDDDEAIALAANCAGLPSNLTPCKREELPPDIQFETIYVLKNGWINA